MSKQVEKRKHHNNVQACLGTHKVAAVARDVDIPERTFWRILDEDAPIPPNKLELLAVRLGVKSEDLLKKIEIWNVPYQRNPFFTGREEELEQIHKALRKHNAVAVAQQLYALCGLGGIGKTQTVLEYAYRYRDEYAAVMWVKADTQESLLSDMLSLASVLDLPEKNVQDQAVTMAAIVRWFREQRSWLLIFDNADDLRLAQGYIPTGYRGHILLTTRAQTTGRLAYRLEVEEMNPTIGALFLLRRTGRVTPDGTLDEVSIDERDMAMELVRELGGLPLALDQAGAYMDECACSLADYRYFYQTRSLALLSLRGGIVDDHPESVATTWSISFAEVERLHPTAADLLRVCAFLDPDAIPEELIVGGAAELGPYLADSAPDALALNQAVGALWKYSLIRRNVETRMLSLHRLVQVMLKETMDENTQRLWAERVVRALHHVFPLRIEITAWNTCQRLLIQAQACVVLIEQWNFTFVEAAQLLNQVAYYLREQARYAEAEVLYQRALAICEHTFGLYHTETAQVLYNLARLYFDLGQYTECETLHLRVLVIREQVLPPDHLDIALSLNSLAFLYYLWEVKADEAEKLFNLALSIFDRAIGMDHPKTAHCLSNLALLYASENKYTEAEQLLLQVQAIRETSLGPVHLDTARSLQNLAWLYIDQKMQERYEEAKQLLERSLDIRMTLLGPDHPQIAISLTHLAFLHEAQECYDEAEKLYQRALGIREKMMGKNNPKVISTEKCYAGLLRKMGRNEEAAQLEAHVQAVHETQVKLTL